MALKEVRPHQRNRQPVSLSCKPSAAKKKEPVQDPWSFLELIDAPQWTDLSLEASLMDNEWHDPWFDTIHKHHAISLADKNISRKGLLFGKPKSKMKLTKSQPKLSAQGFKNKDRSSSINSNNSRLSGYQDTSNTFSGSSGISENEQRSRKERLSVTSNFQASCSESRKLSTESALSSLTEDNSDTPTYHSTGVHSKSLHPIKPKLRFSFELRNSNLIKQQRDRQSSASSGLTSTSTASCSSDEQCDMLNGRKSEVCSKLRTVSEGFSDHEDSGRALNVARKSVPGHSRSEPVIKDLRTAKKASTYTQQIVAKSGVVKRDKNSQNQHYQAQPFCLGKENENPSCGRVLKESQKVQLVTKSSMTVPLRKSLSVKSVPSLVPKNSSVVSRVLSIQNVPGATNARKSMMIAAEKHLGDKSHNSENDLADLVAKHNQKVKMLQMNQQRKGFR